LTFFGYLFLTLLALYFTGNIIPGSILTASIFVFILIISFLFELSLNIVETVIEKRRKRLLRKINMGEVLNFMDGIKENTENEE